MAVYCAHYITLSGETFGTEIVRVEDDEAAIQFFQTHLKSPWASGIEVWQDNRLVYKEVRR
jgi:hypothetical protein